MKKNLLLQLLLFIGLTAFSQPKINADSLIHVVVTRISNIKVVSFHNPDSLFKTLPSTNSPRNRIKLVYQIINYGQETSKQSLNYHYKILDWARKNNDRIIEAVISSELAFEIFSNGDIADGLQMDIDALRLAKQTGYDQAIGIAYNSLASCYDLRSTNDSVNLKLALFYSRQGLKYSLAAHDDLFTCYGFGAVAYLYKGINKTDSAMYYMQKSFEYAIRNNVAFPMTHGLMDLGQLQTNNGLKLKYYHAANEIATKNNDTLLLIISSKNLATYYENDGKMDSAFFYARKAYRLSHNKSLKIKIEPTFLLSKLYEGRNTDSTLKYIKIYYATRDSMFSISKMQRAQAITYADQQRRQELEAQKARYQSSLRFYLLILIIAFLILLSFIFWRNNKRNKKAKLLLQQQKTQIQLTLRELEITQNQLIQSAKMASLGELTAGIAHEIQNPLNFVNNFSEVSKELMEELKEDMDNGNAEEAKATAADIIENLEKITYHGKRADGIVKGMLEHSRTSRGIKERVDINILANEYFRLAYQGLRAKDKTFNVELVVDLNPDLPKANIIQQDMGRVLLNLLNNAFYAVNQRSKKEPVEYKPEVTLITTTENGQVVIKVKDNGVGIPDVIKDKIMQPFFTTKPTGEGTGLGLSLSYDIVVKGHNGTLVVNSRENEYTEFVIALPV